MALVTYSARPADTTETSIVANASGSKTHKVLKNLRFVNTDDSNADTVTLYRTPTWTAGAAWTSLWDVDSVAANGIETQSNVDIVIPEGYSLTMVAGAWNRVTVFATVDETSIYS